MKTSGVVQVYLQTFANLWFWFWEEFLASRSDGFVRIVITGFLLNIPREWYSLAAAGFRNEGAGMILLAFDVSADFKT
jgi:hypothetical protein